MRERGIDMVEANFMEFMEEQLKDPALKAEYDALEPEYAAAQAELDAQNAVETRAQAASHHASSLIQSRLSAIANG